MPGDEPRPNRHPKLNARYVFIAFWAGYLLSYLYRTVNAVISPELTRELGLAPSALGLLTSAYFVAFAAMQLPAGVLLDRYGPRRVEPALLALAGAGVLLFAHADGTPGLVGARAMIGAGVAVCLMAPLKAIAAWVPRTRQASFAGWVMTAGSAGALMAATPTEFALRFVHWRTLFLGLALPTFAVAVWIWLRVPDIARPVATPGLRLQLAGVRTVFSHPRFWWIAPLAGCCTGSFFALQGLWSVPWLTEVNGFDRGVAAGHLFWMGIVMLAVYLTLGLFAARIARYGLGPRHLFGVGFALNILAFAAIVGQLPGTRVWWGLYGLGAATNVLAFTVLNDGFAADLAGRANTALNLMMFGGGFVAQWGIGLVVDAARAGFGLDAPGGLRFAFALVLALNVIAYLWFAWGWRRHAPHAHAAGAGERARGPSR
jgi:predicted MFS family arabinose efflux permease